MPEDKTGRQDVETKETEKTFTQSQLDAIVADRLSREREKYAGFEDLKKKAEAYDQQIEASKTDLQRLTEERDKYKSDYEALEAKETARKLREEVAKEKGIDPSVLRGSTKEELEAHADQLKALLGDVKKYPEVKDGGEPPKQAMTKDEILKIKDERKRLQAIKENIELFK